MSTLLYLTLYLTWIYTMSAPKMLYKYRTFSTKAVEMLCRDELYFADPSSFNDPLDTRPCLQPDCDNDRLVDLLSHLVIARQSAELHAAAKTIKYRGPKTLAHIEKMADLSASQAVQEAKYMATYPELDKMQPEEALRWILTARIEAELLLQYDKGICALAERHDCPLMWSHYGDQHRGLCIGYTIPNTKPENLEKVMYGGQRIVSANDVASMVIERHEGAKKLVEAAILLRKAVNWKYEKEWRLIGNKGAATAPLDMYEIIFGMRCSTEVKFSVVKALESRGQPVKFFEMTSVRGTFALKKQAINIEEMMRSYPWFAKKDREMFLE